jgi:hypothetical protein
MKSVQKACEDAATQAALESAEAESTAVVVPLERAKETFVATASIEDAAAPSAPTTVVLANTAPADEELNVMLPVIVIEEADDEKVVKVETDAVATLDAAVITNTQNPVDANIVVDDVVLADVIDNIATLTLHQMVEPQQNVTAQDIVEPNDNVDGNDIIHIAANMFTDATNRVAEALIVHVWGGCSIL